MAPDDPVRLADGRLVEWTLVHDLDEMAQEYADAHGTTVRLAREAMAAVLADRLG